MKSQAADREIDDFAHHRLSSSGLVHAANTMRAGPSNVRVAGLAVASTDACEGQDIAKVWQPDF